MFIQLRRQFDFQTVKRQAGRFLTESASQSTSPTIPFPPSGSTKPYYVPRNSRGNIPVYSDIKNAGGRHLVHIRNVEGDISALAKELSHTLFPTNSQSASKLKVQVNFGKHVILTGGQWKSEVMQWLKTRGF